MVRAGWVLTPGGRFIRDGAVLIREGMIVDVGPGDALTAHHPGVPLTALDDHILSPGFIDAHCHLEWSLVGELADRSDGFGPWIGRLLGLGPFPEEFFPRSSALGALRALQAGTTTLSDNAPAGTGVDAVTATGQRAIVHREVFGSNPAQATERAGVLHENLAALSERAGPRVEVGVSPHAVYSTCPALWEAIAQLDPVPDRWSTHIAESADECDELAGPGRLAEALTPHGIPTARDWPAADGRSPVRAMNDAGALRPGLIAAHLVHIDADDIALLVGNSVRAVHCPISNINLHCGRFPLELARAAGLPVGLGTDSPASAGAFDVRAEARACMALHTAAGIPLSAEEAVELMTAGGAEVLQRADLGAIRIDARADLVAVKPPAEAIPGNPYAALLAPGGPVTHVWVDGEMILADGVPTNVEVDQIEANASQSRRKLC